MTFVFYKQFVRDSIKSGTIKLYEDESRTHILPDDYLTDFDIAIQFAIYEIIKREGEQCLFTVEDVYNEIAKFAPELLEVEK